MDVAKTGWSRDFKMNWSIYLLFIPVFLFFFIFNYLPMFGIVMAFQDFSAVRGFFGSDFVGLQNFIDFFSSPSFLQILRNTLVISFMGIFLGMPASILFALFLNEVTVTKFKRTVQTISYLPFFVSAVVIAGMVIDFVASRGIITDLLVAVFGIPRENLLTNPSYFWWINFFTDLWQGLGYGAIIFIAAITGVSSELHEAAAIDGASRLRRCWHVTLPALKPTIIMLLILRLGMVMTVGFDRILLLYNPSIFETADVIATHVVRLGIERMQFGYAAAVGLFNSLIGTALLIGSNMISRKLADTSIY